MQETRQHLWTKATPFHQRFSHPISFLNETSPITVLSLLILAINGHNGVRFYNQPALLNPPWFREESNNVAVVIPKYPSIFCRSRPSTLYFTHPSSRGVQTLTFLIPKFLTHHPHSIVGIHTRRKILPYNGGFRLITNLRGWHMDVSKSK